MAKGKRIILSTRSLGGPFNLHVLHPTTANHCLQVAHHFEVVPALDGGHFSGGEYGGQVVVPEVVPDEDAEDLIEKLLFFEGEEGAVGVLVGHEGLDGLPHDEISRVVF